MKKIICMLLTSFILAFILCIPFGSVESYANERTHNVIGKSYENADESNYDYSKGITETMSFGNKTIGKFYVYGDELEVINGENELSYNAINNISFGYLYGGNYQTNVKEDWNLISDDNKNINGYVLSNKIEKGALLVQKSTDGQSWENAIDPVCNFFDNKKINRNEIYKVSNSEIISGTYFRVILAYKIAKKTGTEGLLNTDVFEKKECVEVYKFYVSTSKNNVSIKDILTRNSIGNEGITTSGFYIQKNDSNSRVNVKHVSKEYKNVDDLSQFTETGKYTIEIITDFGKHYYYNNISITEGMNTIDIAPKVYENEDNKGYVSEKQINGNTVYNDKSYTSINIGVSEKYNIKKGKKNGYDAYGIDGDSIRIFLKLKYDNNLTNNGWEISSDTWGKRENEKISGAQTGQIEKGALVVQSSMDGKNWVDVDKGKYANGLYTTDFGSHYNAGENILLFTPNGEEILKGIYLRILYAYEVSECGKSHYVNYLEKYEMYLCSSRLDAVTFHNLTIADQINEIYGDLDEESVKAYKKSETLSNGNGTVTGFSIDTSLNPTLTYSIKRDGQVLPNSADGEYKANGRYDVTICNVFGDKKIYTIYIDKINEEESLKAYFNNNFISGKRIYAENDYPVYEGGHCSYYLSKVPDNMMPIGGTIKNSITGKVIKINTAKNERKGIINEPGEYVAELMTNYSESNMSGDTKVFQFHFTVIAEGTAPGPTINKNNLADYAHSNISDCYPIYYQLTFQSALTGYINLAFATKEDAVEYAYNYEKGMVEKQEDGTYRYNGDLEIDEKEKYDSNWELTDAINHFAEKAVREYYFDLTDQYTYCTLDNSAINDISNLRTLELNKNVTLFAEGQKEKLTDIDALPIINAKKYAIVYPGRNGRCDNGFEHFKFIKDKYGCDSNSIYITDSNGKQYIIKYNIDVDEQLEKANCPSGKIVINESTKYGDSVTYEAVYFAEDDNTTELTILGAFGDKNKEIKVSKENNREIIVNAFSLVDARDELDPYSLIQFTTPNNETFRFTLDDIPKSTFSELGTYTIKIINRVGYSYDIIVNVTEQLLQIEDDTTDDNVQEQAENVSVNDAMESNEIDDNNQHENEPNSSKNVNSIGLMIVCILLIGIGLFLWKRKRDKENNDK